MPTNVGFQIPFLGGGPTIAEQIMQGLHEGFQEKQQKQEFALKQKTAQSDIARNDVLNVLTQAQTRHAAVQNAYEEETDPTRKQQLLTDLHKSQVELATKKHTAKFFGVDLDNLDKAANEAANPPPKEGEQTPLSGFQKEIQNTKKFLGKMSPDEEAIFDNAANVATRTLDATPVTSALAHITQQRATNARAELETTPFKSWQAKFTRENGREPTSAEIERFQTLGPAAGAAGRGEITNKDYYDSETGSIVQLNPNAFNKLNEKEVGRYVEYSPTVANTLKAQGLLNGIKDISAKMRSIYNDPNFEMDAKLRAKLSLAARAEDKDTFNTIVAGIALDKLTPLQMDYFNYLKNLHERSMSFRGLQGQGAGSDSQREAIFHSIPGLIDNSKMALKRLDTFDNEVQNIDKTIPRIGKQSKRTAGEEKAGTVTPTATAPKVPSFADWDKQQQPPQP